MGLLEAVVQGVKLEMVYDQVITRTKFREIPE
jgi:hypothetical protein